MKKLFLTLVLFTAFSANRSFAQAVFSWNFEDLAIPAIPADWTNTHTGSGLGWTSSSSFPYASPHTTYMAVSEMSGTNHPAILTTPLLSFAAIAHPVLVYDVAFYPYSESFGGADTVQKGYVQCSSGGSPWNTIDSMGYAGDWDTRHVDISTYAGVASLQLRFVYSDMGALGYGAAIDNVTIIDEPAADLALTVISPASSTDSNYFSDGTAVNFTATVQNLGYNTVNSFTFTYKQGTNPPVNYNVTGVSILPFSSYTFTDAVAYTMPLSAPGSYPFTVWVSLTGDAAASNDTLFTQLIEPSFMPVKVPVFECATGTWAGYCPRGIVYMDSLQRLFPGYVWIANVHDNDVMANDNLLSAHYDTFATSIISGFPETIIDRKIFSDPSFAISDYNYEHSKFGYADISAGTVSVIGDSAFVPVTVTPAVDLSGDYRLELLVVEDSVHDAVTPGYAQVNYYSGMASPLSETGYNYNLLPDPVPASVMYYSCVARTTVPDMLASPNGIAGSLPATMTAGATYTYSFDNVLLQPAWVSTSIHGIILFIDNATGNVLNSQGTPHFPARMAGPGTLLVNNAGIINNVTLYPNPAEDQVHISFELNTSSPVSISVFDALGSNAISHAAETLSSGAHNVDLSTAHLAAGIYQVKITVGNETIIKSLSVIK